MARPAQTPTAEQSALEPPLDMIAAGLESTAWAAELVDPEWRLRWCSTQLKAMLGESDDEALGVGSHLVAARYRPAWQRAVPPGVQTRWLEENVGFMLDDTPGGRETIAAMVPPEHAGLVRAATARGWPVWTSKIDSRGSELELGHIRYFGARARTSAGRQVGTIYIYGSALPASLLAMVARGDPAMFQRMARLVEPGRREAALLFADLQASGSLSRHLPSAAYFQLIREVTTVMDAEVGAGGGIVGKHAGDGVTAFFLAEDLGGPSAAAAAAISAARGMAAAVRRLGDDVPGIKPGELTLNVGLHWGATLYMGQLSTGNRLEVTALGDEVNECARVEQSARDGAVLATKALIERLDPADAEGVGIDPVGAQYRALAELPGASEKALRDAGSLAVCALG